MELRAATAADVERITTLVDAAYGHYVERIGTRPKPMRENYAQVVAEREVTVAILDGELAGVVVFGPDEEGLLIDNVAVDPGRQGTGVGRALLEHAEARAREAGYDSVYLYTHELMSENRALYARIGYAEYDARRFGSALVIFLRKPLG